MPDIEVDTFTGINTQDTAEQAEALADETGASYQLVRDPDGALFHGSMTSSRGPVCPALSGSSQSPCPRSWSATCRGGNRPRPVPPAGALAGPDGQVAAARSAVLVDTLVARGSDGSRVHSRTATIADTPIRWVESGEGPTPVVLIHGIPTSPDLWRHVTPLLDGVRVLAFEMVGYGRSIAAGDGRDISVAAQARYLDAWLDHLGLDRVVLVGHDLGGGVAQISAVGRPARCAGLLLTNAIAYDSWPIPRVRAMRAVPQLVERTPPALLEAGIGMLLAQGHDDTTIARESLDIHFSHYAAQAGYAGTALARQVTALDVRDTLRIADRLPDLDVPSRIVWGLADQFQKASYGQRLARDLRARAIGIRGGKHFTPEGHPDVIASAIRELVDQAA